MNKLMRQRLDAEIRELERCARQNEADAKSSSRLIGNNNERDADHANIVASEQRRMLRILKSMREDCK